MTREELKEMMPVVQAYVDDEKKDLPNKSNIIKEIEMWLARDKDDYLFLFIDGKPEKDEVQWLNTDADYIQIDSRLFPEVKWSDEEPTKVKLVIDK